MDEEFTSQIIVSAVIKRADGTVEDLGIISDGDSSMEVDSNG